MSYHLLSTRVEECIDVFVNEMNQDLRHYWASYDTQWTFQSELLFKGAVGKPACIRTESNIHVYTRTQDDRLLHLWRDNPADIFYKSEILAHNLASSPVAIAVGTGINVFYFNNENVLICLNASPSTEWVSEFSRLVTSSNPTSLFAMNTTDQKRVLYFCEGANVVCIKVGAEFEEGYHSEIIFSDANRNAGIHAVCSNEGISLFYVDEDKRISHAFCGETTGWKYQLVGSLKSNPKNGALSAVQYEKHIDLYFVKHDNRIYHGCYGPSNGFIWSVQPISECDATQPTDVSALRLSDKSIDVFYIDKDNELKNLYTGERTNKDWSLYKSGESIPVIEWERIHSSVKLLGQGLAGKTYILEQDFGRLVLKKASRSIPAEINNECTLLLRLGAVEPNFFRGYLHENGTLIGFAMSYVEGVSLEEIIHDHETIFYNSPSARVNLVKTIGLKLKRIQNLGICHCDLNPGNVIIHQLNKTMPDVSATIIDFGCAFCFNSFVQFRPTIPGLRFLKPPIDSKTRQFNRSGINAYQLARLALLVLLQTSKQSYQDISDSPEKEITLLRKKGYDETFIEFLSRGLSNDIQTRNNFLENIDKLTEFTIDDTKIA